MADLENNSLKTQLAILGGGPAGYVAAIRAAQLGADVVLIEEKELGGVCLNVGCIPTKALLKTSDTNTVIKKSKEFGIESSIENINWKTAMDRKNRIIKNLNAGLEQLIKARGITVIKGRGKVRSDRKIIVQTADGTINVICEKMILTTGSSPLLPNVKGIDSDGVMTSNDALNMDFLPEHMVIIGAGVIGLEFATMFGLMGVKITVIELADKILPEIDSEIAAELQKIIKRQGISIKLSAEVTNIEKAEDGLAVTYSQGESAYTLNCEKVLVAVGRKLNSAAIQDLPLQFDKGAIIVKDTMETNIDGVFAAGDITGGKLLAHLAFMEGKVAAENALGINSRINKNAIPACIYTHPEIASVGITEDEAAAAGISIKLGRFNFRNNGRAQTLGEREGMVKIIADESNTIIGAHILGANASEMISELTLAITLKATANDLANIIHPHPTLNEAIWEACGDLMGSAIHKL